MDRELVTMSMMLEIGLTEINNGCVILSNREEVNDTFEKVNIRNELEGKLLFNMFLKEINLFVILMNGALIKQCITMGNSIPKSLVLRLVLLSTVI